MPLKSGQTRKGLRNLSTGVGIPDSEDLHARYDATELSLSDGQTVSTWADETGNGHDLSGSNPTYQTNVQNGNPVVRFDGDDVLDVDFADQSQPNTVFIVVDADDVGANHVPIDSQQGSSNRHSLLTTGTNNDEWTIFAGGSTVVGGTINGFQIISALFDSGDSILRLNGSQVASGDIGSNPLDGLSIGKRADANDYLDGYVAEVWVYPQDKSSIFTDAESALSSKWGISI